jgi:hypothetical protein
MELLVAAQLLSLLITRDHYMEVKRRAGEDFAGTLAEEMLDAVNLEIEYMTAGINILQFY